MGNVQMLYLLFIALYPVLEEQVLKKTRFSATAYRISVGVVMLVTGDGVTLQWCDVPGVLLPRVGDRRFFFQEVPPACLVFAHPVLMILRSVIYVVRIKHTVTDYVYIQYYFVLHYVV